MSAYLVCVFILKKIISKENKREELFNLEKKIDGLSGYNNNTGNTKSTKELFKFLFHILSSTLCEI